MEASGVHIVVLNWNGAADTIDCLRSLAAAVLGGAAVTVVDNGSRDDSLAAIRRAFPVVDLLPLPENRGYAGGNNAGICHALAAGARAVLLLNNDTRVAPDFLDPLVDAMNSSPIAGAVSGAVLRMDRPDVLDVAWCEWHPADRHVVQIIGVNAMPGEGYDRRRAVPIVMGCSVLIAREALERVGLFDEAYFAYHEDVDWSLRAHRAGYELFFEPLSRVYHRGSRSTGMLRGGRPAVIRRRPRADLPNAEPLPWNPVRTYLGARNTCRLLRTYASPRERRAFARAVLREVPLEWTAVLMDEAPRMRMGDWSWRTFAREYFVFRHDVLREPPRGTTARVRRALARVVLPVVDALVSLPRDVLRAWRHGQFAECAEYLRGLRDGALDRPLPLERLGLR
jgi:GT2 family glycosyltransferase